MPLQPMMRARAFAKWGTDFVGPIDPPAHRTHAQYIIVATYGLCYKVGRGKGHTKE